MKCLLKSSPIAVLLALAACTTVPTGPAVMVLPGTGKSFDQFRFDDGACRQFAFDQIGGWTAARAQEDSAVKSAVVGTAVGAIAGAAIGGNSAGAATGAGVGLLGGSLAGAGAADQSARGAQYRYDVAYQQCMYAKGHRIPVSGRFTYPQPAAAPAASYPPPPPPNYPPPPPQ
ncbi:MAG: hypothetical protein HYS46_04765 [Betaproteobacteria bacterium]|nr:hypothetical protein [Betaproteobacteria bacterium]